MVDYVFAEQGQELRVRARAYLISLQEVYLSKGLKAALWFDARTRLMWATQGLLGDEEGGTEPYHSPTPQPRGNSYTNMRADGGLPLTYVTVQEVQARSYGVPVRRPAMRQEVAPESAPVDTAAVSQHRWMRWSRGAPAWSRPRQGLPQVAGTRAAD